MQKPAPAYSRAASTLTLLAVLFLSAAALRVCLPVACKAVKNVWRMTYDLDPLYWGRWAQQHKLHQHCRRRPCAGTAAGTPAWPALDAQPPAAAG